MLTTRARWLVVVAFVGTAMGILRELDAVAHLGLAVLLWVGTQWLIFQWRKVEIVQLLHGERWLSDASGRTQALWLRRTFEVHTRLRLNGDLVLPYLIAADRLPKSLEVTAGSAEKAGSLETGQEMELVYTIRPLAAGEIRFEGVQIRLTDLQGFFFSEHFLHLPQTFRVLPALLESDPTMPQVKRYNLLPPPGMHRHPRPGIGFELLELRDYVPGDPPRSIAWKVSARRDRLMSKDFESEVPVRCTLFVDASNSVRIGHPGPTALSHLVELAACIAQTAVANRDPVGLCVFDERGSQFVPTGAAQRQVIRIMNCLAEAAGRAPAAVPSAVDGLLLQAYLFAREVYPEMLQRRVNRVPFRIFPLRPHKRKRRRWRVLMASFLSEYYRLGPGDPVRLLHDDVFLAEVLQGFLGEHHVGYEGQLYDERGRYLFAAEGKVPVLAKALTRCVGKGRDNELFILMADLLEPENDLGALMTAIKVAVARHHLVLLLCPWPVGIEVPKAARIASTTFTPAHAIQETRSQNTHPARSASDGSSLGTPVACAPGLGWPPSGGSKQGVADLVRQIEAERLEASFQDLRAELARLGVPVVCAAASQSAHFVMAQLEQLRFGRMRR